MTETTETYHHGDLPNALRHAAADVIIEKGLGSFSLREVARRAGVSHAAPAHHFGDTSGLLTSLAIEAFSHLERETAAAADAFDDPIDRLTAIGRGYVRIGVDHPAHCQILFRNDVVNVDDPAYKAAGEAAYAVLEDAVAGVADAINPDLNRCHAAKLCWAAMQGLIVLHQSMAVLDRDAGREPESLDALVTAFTEMIIDGFRPRS
ncbi:MAG: TetR/AcrR family transcriptional regulator [Actinomycetota bacterium]